ncbi:MAG: aryl-sulfate sulfotransferase [Phycisphaerales bacterium]|nr:aryl-sulfate sulfotransferase [Phycisphaerales bacterium]
MTVLRTSLLITIIAITAPHSSGEVYDGYTLYNVLNSSTTYLRDNNGNTIETWTGADRPASTPYLLDNGVLLRPCRIDNPTMEGGAVGGRIQKIAMDGQLLWDYTLSTYELQPHHEVISMPGGNALFICWHRRSNSEAAAAGRTGLNGELWSLSVVEVAPTGPTSGEIVWQWNLWDHLVQDVSPSLPNYGDPGDFPHRFDVNFGSTHGQGGDWIHANGMDYHQELDQIVISSHYTHEFYIIDHSTTTEEAAGSTGGNAGMGGDILYRWGNPAAYNRGSSSDQVNYVLHGVNWIDEGMPGAGNIIWFNNGDRNGSQNDYSSVLEITPPLQPDGTYAIGGNEPFGPHEAMVVYEDENTFYANHLSGAFRLANSNTLATEGTTGTFLEIDPNGNVVWQYDISGQLAKAQKLPTDCLDPVEPCPGDVGGDGMVGVDDILALIAAWGSSDPDADVDGSGTVDANDVLAVLSAWGDCP